jgi:hypothetical protein
VSGSRSRRIRPALGRASGTDESTLSDTLRATVERRIEWVPIQPGKPAQTCIESFDGRLREECLTVSGFQDLFAADRPQP